MPERGLPRLPRWVTLASALALRAFPAAFRRRFEDSMLDAFESGWVERRERGLPSAARYVVRTWANLVVNGLLERARPSLTLAPSRREGRGGTMRGALAIGLKELGYAVRGLARRPSFTAMAVLTLALGTGANTAMFSLVNGVLLEPLPYPDADELLSVRADWSGEWGVMSYPDIVDLREQSGAIEKLIGVSPTSLTLTGLGSPEMIRTTRVTEGLLETFGLRPQLGRDIRADEFGPTGARVALVSNSFWQSRLGADPDPLGRTFELDGITYSVVGVAPREFDYPVGAMLWIPRVGDFVDSCGRGCHTMSAVGKLSRDATLESARVEADQIAIRLEGEYRDTNLGKRFLVESLQDRMVGEVREGLVLMLGAVALVLLIACVNVANLLLVRASTRTGEFSLRKALGASRARLLGVSFLESGVLALLGGAVGVLFAYGVLHALPLFAGGAIPRLENASVDASVLLFSLGVVAAVTLLFGFAPAVDASRVEASPDARRTGGGGSRRSIRLRAWLVAGEVALSTTLLIGAGLLVRTFRELYAIDPGYRTENILRFELSLPRASYASLDEIRIFYRDLEGRIAGVPGVESVGSAWSAPLVDDNASSTVYVSGRPDPAPEDEVSPDVIVVGPGFMETMGITVASGRTIEPADDEVGAEPVVLVNKEFVNQVFPDEDPLGHLIKAGLSFGFPFPESRIVGVIPDLHMRSLTEPVEPEIWIPHGKFGPGDMTVTMRLAAGATDVVSRVRDIVGEMDPSLPIYRVETMEQAVGRQVAPTRFYLILALGFALLAAVLAAVGLYGVAAYAAAQRTREIGLRIALGARRPEIVSLMFTRTLRPALWGLLVGLALALAGGRLLDAVLYGVRARDPVTFVSVALLLGAVVSAATLLPAERASRLDPVESLRAE